MDCATAGQNGRRQACPTSHCKVSRGISSKTASVVAGKPKPRSGEPDWCSYSAIAGSPKPRSGEPDWYPYDVQTPEALAFGSCPEKSKKDAIANCSNHILGQGSAEPKEGFGRTGVRTLLTDKLLFEGAETLTDCEMLQVALSLASPKGRPATVATNLLTHLGSYAAVLWAEDDCLLRVPGVNHRHISMLKTLRLGAVHSLRRDAFRSSLRVTTISSGFICRRRSAASESNNLGYCFSITISQSLRKRSWDGVQSTTSRSIQEWSRSGHTGQARSRS